MSRCHHGHTAAHVQVYTCLGCSNGDVRQRTAASGVRSTHTVHTVLTAYCIGTVYVPYVRVWYARPAPSPLWRVLTPVPRTAGQPARPLSAAGPRAALLSLVRASCQPIVVVCQSRFPARLLLPSSLPSFGSAAFHPLFIYL